MRSVAGLPPAERGLLPGLVDGDTSALPEATAQDFRTAGLTHLVAVSGSNVAFVLAAVLVAVRWLGLRGYAVPVTGALGLYAFLLVARPEPSVVRATLMGLLVLAARGSYFALDAFHSVSPLAHPALGARKIIARLIEFAIRGFEYGARSLESRAQRRGLRLSLLDPCGSLFQRRSVRRVLRFGVVARSGDAAAGDHFSRRHQVAVARDEERAMAV